MSRLGAATARANDRLFAHGGDEAVLRVNEPQTVIVSGNVEIFGDHGLVEQMVTTATFNASAAPRARDPLTILTGEHAGSYVLDKPVERKGASSVREWILRAP